MNKTLLSSALVAVIAATAFAPTAQAADGTITISGKVLTTTCTVGVNGGATVVLPSVMTTNLATVGAVAGAKNFDVKLTSCDSNIATATMGFSGGNIDTTTGNLKNTVTTGSNAQIQLKSGASVINTSTNANAPVITVTGGTGSTTMTAQYIATAAPTSAGAVQSSVDFTLTYL